MTSVNYTSYDISPKNLEQNSKCSLSQSSTISDSVTTSFKRLWKNYDSLFE